MVDNQFDKAVGIRIAQLIKALDMQKGEFAEAMEVNQGNLSKVLSGERGLAVEKGVVLSDKFGVSLDWLYSGNGEMFLSKVKSPIEEAPGGPAAGAKEKALEERLDEMEASLAELMRGQRVLAAANYEYQVYVVETFWLLQGKKVSGPEVMAEIHRKAYEKLQQFETHGISLD